MVRMRRGDGRPDEPTCLSGRRPQLLVRNGRPARPIRCFRPIQEQKQRQAEAGAFLCHTTLYTTAKAAADHRFYFCPQANPPSLSLAALVALLPPNRNQTQNGSVQPKRTNAKKAKRYGRNT